MLDRFTSGLSGNGSTVTDYTCALAFGAKFSPPFGFLIFTDGKKETTLMEIDSMKNLKYKVDMPSPDFVTVTVEIILNLNVNSHPCKFSENASIMIINISPAKTIVVKFSICYA